jgi:hypothetical protein
MLKIKYFCSVKIIIKRMGRQVTDREKIFVRNVSHKEVLSKILKETLKFNNYKTSLAIKNRQIALHRLLTKEDLCMTNEKILNITCH